MPHVVDCRARQHHYCPRGWLALVRSDENFHLIGRSERPPDSRVRADGEGKSYLLRAKARSGRDLGTGEDLVSVDRLAELPANQSAKLACGHGRLVDRVVDAPSRDGKVRRVEGSPGRKIPGGDEHASGVGRRGPENDRTGDGEERQENADDRSPVDLAWLMEGTRRGQGGRAHC